MHNYTPWRLLEVGGWGTCSCEGQRAGPDEEVTKGSKKAYLRKRHTLTKSDHKSVEIDVSRNNTDNETVQGANLLKNDLREPKTRTSKQAVPAG